MRDIEVEFLPGPFPPAEPRRPGRRWPITIVLAASGCLAALALSLSPAGPLRAGAASGQLRMAYIALRTPTPVLDTRSGIGGHRGPQLTGPVLTGMAATALVARTGLARLADGQTREFTVPDSVVPRDVRAVALEVTLLSPRHPGTLRVAAHGSSATRHAHRIRYGGVRGTTSLLTVDLPTSRAINVSAHGGAVDVAMTVVGYLVPLPLRHG